MSDGADASPAEAATKESLAKIYGPMLAVTFGVVLLDIVSKQWADGLDRCQQLAKPPTVGFCLAYNEGMAFSVGWGSGAIIAGVALVIVVVLLMYARKVPLYPRLLMGLVAGGAIGNVLDRAFRAPAPGSGNHGFMSGAVVDFVYTKFWATFNLADSAIVVGGILLAIALWRLPDPETEPTPAPDDGDASANSPNDEAAQLPS
jgi:signal peptidase II